MNDSQEAFVLLALVLTNALAAWAMYKIADLSGKIIELEQTLEILIG